mmetsp:Transcript_890/g.1414  ORF Transcript_890/g.1414 Transcript_890/m.1414 type:complete len:319 (-) Transcript_890:35-991(-)
MEYPAGNYSNDDEGTHRLVERLCIELHCGKAQCININRTRFSDQQAEELARALLRSTSVQRIDVRGSDLLTPKGFIFLVEAITKTNLITHFEIADVEMNDEAMESIGKLIQVCSSLKSFGLSKIRGKKITQRGWNMLITSLSKNSNLRVLNMSDNHINDDIAVRISNEVLQQTKNVQHHSNTSKLQCLVLSSNHIHDKGAISIAHALLHNTTLKMLALADNEITIESLHTFEKTLQVNCTLQRCYLFGNRFRHDCYQKSHISYFLNLNVAGRGFFRDETNGNSNAALLPYLIARRSQNPNIVYGLLSELPHVWVPSKN